MWLSRPLGGWSPVPLETSEGRSLSVCLILSLSAWLWPSFSVLASPAGIRGDEASLCVCWSVGLWLTLPNIISSLFLSLLLYLDLSIFLSVCPQSSPRFSPFFHLSLQTQGPAPPRRAPTLGGQEGAAPTLGGGGGGGIRCPSPTRPLAPPPGAGAALGAPSGRWRRCRPSGPGSPPRSLPLPRAPSRAAPPRHPASPLRSLRPPLQSPPPPPSTEQPGRRAAKLSPEPAR